MWADALVSHEMTVDELESHGLVRMDDAEIRGFLSTQGTGVLGLPGEEVPYMIPMSYGFDGEALYFSYVLGSESRKAALTGEGTPARFLVYRADTTFNWESVLASGVVEAVPGAEREAVLEACRKAGVEPDETTLGGTGRSPGRYRSRLAGSSTAWTPGS